jgi:capsule biosynthesis phosphatase
MLKKIIVIPLGATGNRFKDAEYKLPKPLINVMGKPIIYWLLENLNLSCNSEYEYVYIPYNRELKKYRFEDLLIKDFKNLKFEFFCLEFENDTRGVAETLKFGLEYLKNKKNIDKNNDLHVMCIDDDVFFTENILKHWNGENLVISFYDEHYENDKHYDPIYSYVKLDNRYISDIREKNKISNNACCGVYAFHSFLELLDQCKYVVENNIKERGEFYISCVIKNMLNYGEKIHNKTINKNSYHCLGSPLQIKLFCNNFNNICHRINKNLLNYKRYCFDLDNTLVTFPKISGDYTTVEPIQTNIDILKNLKKMGHTIIIYTARRMETYSGNVGKVIANVAKITFDTLEKFDIPYDEIYFGKPNADYYIDDLALSSFDNLEKALGYYNINVEPRDFNSIESSTFDVIKKSSINNLNFANMNKNLEGEIFYYKSIQNINSIKDLFPIFVNHDPDNRWYQIEKINGISISKLYLSKELTTNILKKIMDSIHQIQNSKEYDLNDNNDNDDNNDNNDNNEKINIYENYAKKLKYRYDNYDYSRFNKSESVYQDLIEKLEYYENNNIGKIKVIHGDTVLTNIILDKYNKLKFIDMRGVVGNKLTIFGDWLYDWAKLYQSLIGYDEILDNIDLDIFYKNKMIAFFKDEFIKNNSLGDFKNLQTITKSLLFTLIPLHDNDKCNRYYNLIFSEYLM